VETKVAVAISVRALSKVEKRVIVSIIVESVISVPVTIRQDTIPITLLEIKLKSFNLALTTRWLHISKVSLLYCYIRYTSLLSDLASINIFS
jgi:hypothetical protein